MKFKHFVFLLIAFAFAGCGTKTLDIDRFTIEVPSNWKYVPGNGTDSFIGGILTSTTQMSFEYSPDGYASGLIFTEGQFLANQTFWGNKVCYFCKPGVMYVPKNEVEKTKQQLLQQKIVTDTSLLKVQPNIEFAKKIHRPDDKQKRYFPNADYVAELTYQDSTITIPIMIPATIKIHNIRMDTTDKYIIKTIWPKTPGIGITAVYFKSRTSKLNFNIQGNSLPLEEQEEALKAFKTIKLKE